MIIALAVTRDGIRWGWTSLSFTQPRAAIVSAHVYADGVALEAKRGSKWFLSSRDWDRFEQLVRQLKRAELPTTEYEGNAPLKSIALAAYPEHDGKLRDEAAEVKIEMLILQDLIVNVRNVRAELRVEPKTKVPIEVFASEPGIRKMIGENWGAVERLANVEKLAFVESSLAKQAGSRSTARFDVHVVYEKKIDVVAECERLKKELEKLEKEFANNQRQLGNEQFLAKAPAKVVEGLRARAGELTLLLEKARTMARELGCS